MKKIISYLTAAAIVFDLFTPFRLYFEGGKALMMLIPTVLIILYDQLFARRSFLPMALYVGAALVIKSMGSSYFLLPSLLSVVFAYAVFEHFIITKDLNFVKIVATSLYGTLVVLVAISLPLFISMPNLSRLMLNAEENGISSPLFYWSISYTQIHSLPVYSIPVFFFARNSRKRIVRLFALAFFVAIFILMLFADSTGAVIVNVAIFAMLLLFDPKKDMKSNIGRLIVVGLAMIVFLNKTVLTRILTTVQPVFIGSSTYKKIDIITTMLNGGDSYGDIDLREENLNMSWNSFVKDPLFPTIEEAVYTKIGGHNFIFDQIVVMGLLLGVFFLWFLIERIRRPLKYLSFKAKTYYLAGVLALLVMGTMKNFFLLFPACCIVPMLLIAADNGVSVVQKKNI